MWILNFAIRWSVLRAWISSRFSLSWTLELFFWHLRTAGSSCLILSEIRTQSMAGWPTHLSRSSPPWQTATCSDCRRTSGCTPGWTRWCTPPPPWPAWGCRSAGHSRRSWRCWGWCSGSGPPWRGQWNWLRSQPPPTTARHSCVGEPNIFIPRNFELLSSTRLVLLSREKKEMLW